MEEVSSEMPNEKMEPQKPPDCADESQEEPNRDKGRPPEDGLEETSGNGPEKTSGDGEQQDEVTNLVKDDGAMILSIDNSFLEDRGTLKDDKGSEVEVTHTEVDLTMELETQRLTGLCRVCAKSKIKMFPVFGSEKNIMEKIHTFLPILVTPDDLLPVKICARCLSSLDQSQKLVQTCLEADKKLRELLENKLTNSIGLEVKSEIDDADDNYDDFSTVCGDDEQDEPPRTLLTDTDTPMEGVFPKREVVSPEPESTPKARPKSVGNSNKSKSENIARRSEVELLESDLLDKDLAKDSKMPNILRKRRTRQTTKDNLSPTILEKMRSYGIKESSVVITKVNIPEDTKSAVVTTVSVPISKDNPKNRNRPGPKRLYRCLYCSETDSDPFKLLLHQMKMHPGNLLKCPHCGFVCGSDQKSKFDAHVSAHSVPQKILPKKVPNTLAVGSNASQPVSASVLPPPVDAQQLVSPPPSVSQKKTIQPKSTIKPKSLLKDSNRAKPGKVPLHVATPVVTQVAGNAIMLRIQSVTDVSAPAPTAIVPMTLYQCARCKLNFNTKEGVGKHLCVIPPNMIPVTLKPGEPFAIAPKPGEPIPIAPKPGEPIPIAPKPGDVNFPCTTCGMNFPDSTLLREHVLTHYQTFKCNVCDTAFRSEFHLKQHSRKHNPEKKEFKCPQCPKVYTVKSRLRVHLHSHSDTPRCVCPQCGKVFRTDGGYRNHIKAHENKRAFACSVCGFRFNRRGNMRRHERNCDGKKALTCKFCSETFEQKDDLLIHRSSVHPELEFNSPIPDTSTGDKEKRYACKVCSEGFVRVMDLRRHQLNHTEEELNAVKDVPDGGAYLCHTCGKQLHHKHNYKLHMMHHQGKALFKCDQCDRTFTSKFSLNYHHMLHTGDFPFKCSVCSESFRTSVALQVHRYKHTGDKPYRCKSCEMGFFTRHSLRLHQVVHSTERNYICRVCGSSFKRRKTLRYHSLIHTGEKPHTCRICGKSFRQKGTCTIHERNHELAAVKKPKANPAFSRRQRVQIQRVHDIEDDMEEIEADVMDEAQIQEMEEAAAEEMENERAAQMVEMEIEEQIETVEEEPHTEQRVWRIADPKVQYRLKNVDWKHPASSQVNEAIFVLRETDGLKEGLPEVCTVQSEVIEGEFLSMYPDIQMHDSEIIEGEKTSIEFTTSDGTIRIIR